MQLTTSHEANPSARSESPYLGLRTYGEVDAAYFFGREQETRLIASNLRTNKLTVLYGGVGVGKSSLLRAGVAYTINQDARRLLETGESPNQIIIVFNHWKTQKGLYSELRQEVAAVIRQFSPDFAAEIEQDSLSSLMLRGSSALGCDILIVLDQFEEYLLDEPDQAFELEIIRAINRDDIRANIMFSLRDDAITLLERFKGRIPILFDNYMRLYPLSLDAAREVIRRPIEVFNREHGEQEPYSIEPVLVEAIVAQLPGLIAAGRDHSGQGTNDALNRQRKQQVETALLQMILLRLWNEAQKQGLHTLRLATFNDLGGADEIIQSHIDTAIGQMTHREKHIAARMFRYLVTPSGTKVAYSATDLASQIDQKNSNQVQTIVESLSQESVRILREVEPAPNSEESRFEIYHDVLARYVLDWRLRVIQSQQARDRLFRLTAVFVAVLIVTSGLIIYFSSLQAANQQFLLNRSIQLGNDSVVLNSVGNTDLSVALALEANLLLAEPPASTQLQLSEIAYEPGAVRVFPPLNAGVQVFASAFDLRGANVLVAYMDGTLVLWDIAANPASARVLLETPDTFIQSIVYSANGHYAVTMDIEGEIILWNTQDWANPVPVGKFSERSAVAFTPSADYLVVAEPSGKITFVDSVNGNVNDEWTDASWDGLNSIAFSSDGQYIAISLDASVSSERPGTVLILDETGSQLAAVTSPEPAMSPFAAQFTPESDRILFAMDGGEQCFPTFPGVSTASNTLCPVWVWEWQGESPLVQVASLSSPITTLSLSADGKFFVAADLDNRIGLWRLEGTSAWNLWSFLPASVRIASVEFSPDGQTLLLSGNDGTMRLWSREWGAVIKRYTGLSAGSGAPIVLSNDEQSAYVGTESGIARLDLETGALHYLTNRAGVVELEANPASTQIAYRSETEIGFIDVDTGASESVQWDNACSRVDESLNIAFSPDGAHLYSLILKNGNPPTVEVCTWDLSTRQQIAGQTISLDGTVFSLGLSEDSEMIFVGYTQGRAALYRRATGELVQHYMLTESYRGNAITSFAFSGDRQLIALGTEAPSAGGSAVIALADVQTGEIRGILNGHLGRITRLLFMPDTQSLVSTAADETLRYWRVSDGALLRTLRGHRSYVFGVDVLSDNGNLQLISNEERGDVIEWRIDHTVEELIDWTRSNRMATTSCLDRQSYGLSMSPECRN